MVSKYQRIRFDGRAHAALDTGAWCLGPIQDDEVAGPTLVSLVSTGTELGWYTSAAKSKKHIGGYPGYTAIMQVETVGPAVAAVKPGDMAFVHGSHQSYQQRPEDSVVPLPPGLAPEAALFSRMMSVTMATLSTTAARPPAKVLITGLGPVGLLGALVFQHCGYEVHAVEPDAARRALAERKGVARVLDGIPLNDDRLYEGMSLAVECSGREEVILQSCEMMHRGGEVVMVGYPWKSDEAVRFHDVIKAMFYRLVTLRSGWEDILPKSESRWHRGPTNNGNIAGAMEWLARGLVELEDLYDVYHPDDCQQAYDDLLHKRTEKLTAIFDWRD